MTFEYLIGKKLKGLLGLLVLSGMLLPACQGGSTPHPIPAIPKTAGDRGPQKWKLRTQKMETEVVVGRLFCPASDPEGRISFQDSLVVQVKNLQGKRLAKLRAQAAMVQRPFELVAVKDFLWECEDGSEIEGSDLYWHVHGPNDITIEGDLQLITDKGIVMGNGLVGDLLLTRYEVVTVQSVVLWDEVAGGREGYRHAQ